MSIRKFEKEDAFFCFKLKSDIFIKMFYEDLGPEIICEIVNSYLPEDYIKMAENSQKAIFIIEHENNRAGFFILSKTSDKVAEIYMIFIDQQFQGKGLGKKAMEFIGNWIKQNWKTTNIVFLDTIIPDYNGNFYLKQGYSEAGDSLINISKLQVNAKRFEKYLTTSENEN